MSTRSGLPFAVSRSAGRFWPRFGFPASGGLGFSALAAFTLLFPVLPSDGAEFTAAEIASRAERAARHMAAAQRADGLFTYEYDFVLRRSLPGDNLVRQAGAAFIVAEYLDRTRDLSFAKTAAWALRALRAKSIAFEDGAVVGPDGSWAKASTGGTALALLAELNYFEATGDPQFADLRQEWLSALEALQRPTGGFRLGPGTEEESSYFNGEAWLALAHVQRLFPAEAGVGPALAKADATMLDRYSRAPDVAFAHWGMMAGAVRYETTGEARFLDFLSTIAGKFITEIRPRVDPRANACSSVEGLAAAARALAKGKRADGDLHRRIVARVEAELANSFQMQIEPGQRRITLGPDRYLEDEDIGSSAGAFLNGRYQWRTRIDFTQHCLSAMIEYGALLRLEADDP